MKKRGTLTTIEITTIEIIEILVLVATFFTVIGIFIAVYDSKKTRRADFLWRLYDKWDSKEIGESRKFMNDLVKRFKNNKEKITQTLYQYYEKLEDQYYVSTRLLNYFENLGYLVRSKGALRLKDVDEVLGSSIAFYWKIVEGSVMKARVEAPTAYENFEWLCCNISQIRAEKMRK